ncbi:MAG: hypothetical protein AAF738_07180 [Bacteroidota bacterium]
MKTFLAVLKTRNITFYWMGWFCIGATVVCATLATLTETQIMGINAWIKPMKFYLSTTILVWTLAWLLHYLKSSKTVQWYTRMVMFVFVFELFYITYKAASGGLSHFDISTPFSGIMFALMGILISIMTLWTAYIGGLFFFRTFPELPNAYVWGIRLGFLLFVIFAFEGGMMANQMAHTVGAADGGTGLPLVNWSVEHGDLRIAHFLGMHALQILPLAAYYVFKKSGQVLVFALLYALGVSWTLWNALQGMPLVLF